MVNVGVVVGLVLVLLGALHILTADMAAHNPRTFMLGGPIVHSPRRRVVFGWVEIALAVLVIATAR